MVPILGRHDPLRDLPLEDLAFSALPDAPVVDDEPRLLRLRIRQRLHAARRHEGPRRPPAHQPACTPCAATGGPA